MIIANPDGTTQTIPTTSLGDRRASAGVVHVQLEENEHINVRLPGGTIVMLTHLINIGNGVHVYEDWEANPIVSYSGRARVG